MDSAVTFLFTSDAVFRKNGDYVMAFYKWSFG